MSSTYFLCLLAVILCSLIHSSTCQYIDYSSYPSYYPGYDIGAAYGVYGGYGYGSAYAGYYGKREAGFGGAN